MQRLVLLSAPVRNACTLLHGASAPPALLVHRRAPIMFRASSYFSTEPPPTVEKPAEGADAAQEPKEPEVKPAEDPLAVLEARLKDQKDQLLRALADAENARTIAKRDVESARQFAITKFAKSLLEVADTLALASASILPEVCYPFPPYIFCSLSLASFTLVLCCLDCNRYQELNKPGNETMKRLMEGVNMTNSLMEKAFNEHGLAKCGVKGEKFDPNLHEALFEMPDPSQEPGTIGQVLKVGYVLKGRSIRPAQVGTIRK